MKKFLYFVFQLAFALSFFTTAQAQNQTLDQATSTFVNETRIISDIYLRSLLIINAAFQTEEELAKTKKDFEDFNATNNPGEKENKMQALTESTSASIKKKLESGVIANQIGSLSDKKKREVGDALSNADLIYTRIPAYISAMAGLSQQAAAGGFSVLKPLIERVKPGKWFLNKAKQDRSSFLDGVKKVAEGAKIEIKPVTSTSTPIVVSSDEFK
jgi:hypothetical protein